MVNNYGMWIPDYPGQSPYQDPQYMARLQQGQQAAHQPPNQPPQQAMTPPTVHADIIQIKSIDEGERYPLGAGMKQMFVTYDESAILLKEQHQTGYTLTVYDKRPPEAKKPPIDPAKFVTKDELEQRLAAITAARPARSALNKGEE